MLADSIIVTGTMNLLNDATRVLLILAPLVAVVLLIAFSIAKSGSDEMDQKKWGKRQKAVIVGLVIAILASTIVQIVNYYYNA